MTDTSANPELVFDPRDGEWSVLLTSGLILSDLVAADFAFGMFGSFDDYAVVQQLGEDAIALNQTPTEV